MSGGPFRQGGAPLRPGFFEEGSAADSSKKGLPRILRRRVFHGFFEEGSAADTAKMMPSLCSACLSHDNKLWNSERKPTQSEQKRMENAQMLINLVARDAVKKALQAESDLVCLIRDTQLAYEGLKKEGKTPNPRSALAWKSQNDIKELDPSAVEAFCLSRSKLLELFTLGCSMLMGAQLDGVAFRLLKALQEMSAVVVHTRALGDKWADVRRNIILGASSPFWPEYQLERVEPPAVLRDSALLLMLVDLGMGEKGVKEWGEQRKAPLVQNLDEVLKLAREKREQARERAREEQKWAQEEENWKRMKAQQDEWYSVIGFKVIERLNDNTHCIGSQLGSWSPKEVQELIVKSETWTTWHEALEDGERMLKDHIAQSNRGRRTTRMWGQRVSKLIGQLWGLEPTQLESSTAELCAASHGV